MDVEVIWELITRLGFPIVCCAALFWKMIQEEKQHEAAEIRHQEEMTKITEALNNNTLAIQSLLDKIKED